MIWSVSMSSRFSTDTRPVIVSIAFIERLASHSRMSTKCPSIAAAAAICGETRCERAPRPWRPSKLRFEVEATRSPGRRDVRVHAQAHRAAGAAPVEPGPPEHLVEPLPLGLDA